jgi:hypothetical protein
MDLEAEIKTTKVEEKAVKEAANDSMLSYYMC